MKLFSIFKKKEIKPLSFDEIMEILISEYKRYNFDSTDYSMIVTSLMNLCLQENVNNEQLSLVRVGQDAIVLESNDKIFKITTLDYQTSSLSMYVSGSDNILKPNYENPLILKNRKISVLSFEKLDTKKITESDVYDMSVKLRDEGYLWYDPLPTNLGRNKDGKLLLLDYGQIVSLQDKDEFFVQKELEVYANMFPKYDEFYKRIKENNNGISM